MDSNVGGLKGTLCIFIRRSFCDIFGGCELGPSFNYLKYEASRECEVKGWPYRLTRFTHSISVVQGLIEFTSLDLRHGKPVYKSMFTRTWENTINYMSVT
jgi:hypothetical protein